MDRPALTSDTDHVTYGARLGGARFDAEACDTVESIEQLLLGCGPGEAYDRYRAGSAGTAPTRVGLLRLHPPDPAAAAQRGPTAWAGRVWMMEAAWYGPLPGWYDQRATALVAYGYILSPEAAGHLEELTRVMRRHRRAITLPDIEHFAAAGTGQPEPAVTAEQMLRRHSGILHQALTDYLRHHTDQHAEHGGRAIADLERHLGLDPVHDLTTGGRTR